MKLLIAGGGVAGAAAACLLGPEATLVEREPAAHDKICGEFISAEAVPYLRRLGLDLEALGAAPVHAVRLVHGRRVATGRLPFRAYGLSRRVLDETLLRRAEQRGARVLRGCAVRSLQDGVAEVAGFGRCEAEAVFLATGKHELRGAKRVPARPPDDLVGQKMYFRLDAAQAAALAGHVELVLFGGGYAGLQAVENRSANLCLLLQRDRFVASGQSWPGVQALLEAESAHLATRLRGASPLLDRPLTIFRVPYGYVHRPTLADPANVFRLGDQAGVIPSFCGDGVAIALHTAFAAVNARHEDAPAYHRRLRRDLGPQIARAGAIASLARAAPSVLVNLARLCPAALGLAARLTRIPPDAISPGQRSNWGEYAPG